eukprot:TRINITY_DN1892_c0_g2_i2.p2 TRINITY_DN1892_c0_g2~~TRINITY_DN1892_c0_g2_i2.p2  ORF type:complete len:156 (-),score=24.99 TRINITY_DN1892_c0_g2_i2:110-577(-)
MPLLYIQMECYFIIGYGLPAVDGIGSWAFKWAKLGMLVFAAALPIILVLGLVFETFLDVFFVISMTLTTGLLIYYAFQFSKSRSAKSKILSFQFCFLAAIFELFFIISLVMSSNPDSRGKFTAYFVLIYHVMIPISSIFLFNEVKEINTDTDHLL